MLVCYLFKFSTKLTYCSYISLFDNKTSVIPIKCLNYNKFDNIWRFAIPFVRASKDLGFKFANVIF